jgi:hypothetical protein
MALLKELLWLVAGRGGSDDIGEGGFVQRNIYFN